MLLLGGPDHPNPSQDQDLNPSRYRKQTRILARTTDPNPGQYHRQTRILAGTTDPNPGGHKGLSDPTGWESGGTGRPSGTALGMGWRDVAPAASLS